MKLSGSAIRALYILDRKVTFASLSPNEVLDCMGHERRSAKTLVKMGMLTQDKRGLYRVTPEGRIQLKTALLDNPTMRLPRKR